MIVRTCDLRTEVQPILETMYFKLNPPMKSVQDNSDFRKRPQTQKFGHWFQNYVSMKHGVQ
jgi:hypothetical protein